MAGLYLFAEDLVTKYAKLVQPIRQSAVVLLRVEIYPKMYSKSPWAFGVSQRYGTYDEQPPTCIHYSSSAQKRP